MKAMQTIVLITLMSLGFTTQAGDYAHSAPAIGGYDAVAYQTEERPVRGNGHYSTTHDGATYIFASKANLETFKADPERYAPAYGGYCAFGVSVGKKFIADPEVWKVVDGTLYLNLDANIQQDWLKDVPGRISKADAKWEVIEDKNPATL